MPLSLTNQARSHGGRGEAKGSRHLVQCSQSPVCEVLLPARDIGIVTPLHTVLTGEQDPRGKVVSPSEDMDNIPSSSYLFPRDWRAEQQSPPGATRQTDRQMDRRTCRSSLCVRAFLHLSLSSGELEVSGNGSLGTSDCDVSQCLGDCHHF